MDVYTRSEHPSFVGVNISVPSSNYWPQMWHNRSNGQLAGDGVLVMDNNLNVAGIARLTDSGAWTRSSDRRLKENTRSATHLLERAMALDPVTFRWRDLDDSATADLGSIAQDVKDLLSIPGWRS